MAKFNQNGSLKALQRTKPNKLDDRHEYQVTTFKEQRTLIALTLDSSGSMLECLGEAIRGYNKQLDEIRRHSEHDVYTWLCLFGSPSCIEFPIEKGEVADLFNLTYSNYLPFGSTPLLDAIGYVIRRLDTADISFGQDSKDHLLVVVFSDGRENSSVAYDWAKIGRMVRNRTETGRWTFVFIGPKSQHQQIEQTGFKPENILDWNSANLKGMFAKTAGSLGKFLQARNVGGLLPAFFPEEDK